MSKSWAGGSTRRWRKIRRGVLIRDNYQCQIQLTGICTGRATCVHHTLGKAVTGDDPTYLVAACTECNLKIGDPQKYNPQPKPMTKW
jgi:5-methylcytosine-specific restriction endonuclease McrA